MQDKPEVTILPSGVKKTVYPDGREEVTMATDAERGTAKKEESPKPKSEPAKAE